jgi:hypothetical protein
MLVKTFDKMPEEKQLAHIAAAEKYLQQLDALNETEKES